MISELPQRILISILVGLFFALAIIFYAFYIIRVRKERVPKEPPVAKSDAKKQFDYMYEDMQIYLKRNQNQNRNIYILTLTSILIGFSIICAGIFIGFKDTRNYELSIATIIAGTLTEFIATTMLVVYRTIFQQTSEYFKSLERFAAVGMSITIIDSLSEDDQGYAKDVLSRKKIDAKIDVARQISDMQQRDNTSGKA